MDLTPLLTNKLGRAASDQVLQLVLDDPALLDQLLAAFFGKQPELVNMAAMTVGNLARIKPAWLQPHQQGFYEVSLFPTHPGVRRNALRYFCELPVLLDAEHRVPTWVRKKHFLYLQSSRSTKKEPCFLEPALEGELLDLGLNLIRDVKEPTANRAFAIYLLKNLCLKYPELAIEVSGTLSEYKQTGTPGFTHASVLTIDLLDRLMADFGL